MRQHLLQPPHIQQMTAGGAAYEVGGCVGAHGADDATTKDLFGLHGQSEKMPPGLPTRRLSVIIEVERRVLPGHRSHRLAPTPQWPNAVSGSDRERTMPIKTTDLTVKTGASPAEALAFAPKIQTDA